MMLSDLKFEEKKTLNTVSYDKTELIIKRLSMLCLYIFMIRSYCVLSANVIYKLNKLKSFTFSIIILTQYWKKQHST